MFPLSRRLREGEKGPGWPLSAQGPAKDEGCASRRAGVSPGIGHRASGTPSGCQVWLHAAFCNGRRINPQHISTPVVSRASLDPWRYPSQRPAPDGLLGNSRWFEQRTEGLGFFFQVFCESGSDHRQTVAFLGVLLHLGTMHGVRPKGLVGRRGGARDGTGTVGCAGTLHGSWQWQVSGEELGMCGMGCKSALGVFFTVLLLLNEILHSQ